MSHSGSKRPSSDLSLLGKGGGASSSSVGSNSIQRYRYDVFISFRGPDTRKTFVDHLYAHLTRKGIFVFKDDKQLQRGESISQELLQAINDSRISIVVFSKEYASSTWCLDEMAAIAQCREELNQTVFPVFYDVDPSDVRKQKGVYENSFAIHTEQFKHDLSRVDRWKSAMTSLAELGGWDVRNKPEVKEIENIVQAVIKNLGHKFSGCANDLIGIQPRVEELEGLLKLISRNDNFRVLGIWGMGGVGKTTLANVLYDRVSYQFKACCFIEKVSKTYIDHGAIAVQKQILCRTVDEKNLEAYSPSEISGIVRNRLQNIKLLIVLDDVDQFEQLQELHIDPKLLCAGSRIVITTRNQHILTEYGADKVYEVQLMNAYDARKLLCRKAFKSYDSSSSSFAELIHELLNYVQGLPLAITVMGSFLVGRNIRQWRAALNGLQNNPPDKRIMKVLQISFEGLDPREREIFLHVACFFKGEKEDYVRRILDACGLDPEIGIPLITEKSLITIRNQEIHMHEMLQELGKQIVREQHTDEPELWSRLWLYRDFRRVMMTETGATKVKAIVLELKEDDPEFMLRAEDLSKMTRLTLLILCHKNFSGRLISLSNCLHYLSWNDYPFTSLPSTFQPYDLVELNMSGSRIEQLWEGIVHLPCLKRMDLSNSKNLMETPSFERMQNLERLNFTGCINLLQVHPSIGLLANLVFLSLRNCCSLVSLDFGSRVSRLLSLRVLSLSGCTKLQNSPNLKGALNLEYLDMDRCTSLSKVHESLGTRSKLRFLSLRDCTNLVELPHISKSMTSLTTLDLCGCLKLMHLSELTNLPRGWTIFNTSSPTSLISLDLSFCSIPEISVAIGELRFLERLNLQGTNIASLPSLRKLSSLAYLNLSHCSKLECEPELPLESGRLVGRYFKTTSGSRDHRSGLYIFNCLKMFDVHNPYRAKSWFRWKFLFRWILRLVNEPRHFRGGFDIVSPWHEKIDDFPGNRIIPKWFGDQFVGGSSIKISEYTGLVVDWVGFVFCVAFEVNCSAAVFASRHLSPLPLPFYLSFESEYTEERFDMPLTLELNWIAGSKYLWTIYISREHCHFVETGAHITFKASQCLIIKEWGLRPLTKEGIEGSEGALGEYLPLLVIENVREGCSSSNSSFGPKIQLPYNWLVTGEDEVENCEAKGKEINLSNLGLKIGRQ